MMTPQPIATAPTDRDILLFCPLRGWVRGRWEANRYAKKPRPYWRHDREYIWGINAMRSDQPTHWVDLPGDPR